MMGRLRTFRSRANWERSPSATSGHLALHLRTVLALFVVAEWLSFPRCTLFRRSRLSMLGVWFFCVIVCSKSNTQPLEV